MSNETIIYVVAIASGVLAVLAYVGLILIPAWTAYSRGWERLAASFLTLYVLFSSGLDVLVVLSLVVLGLFAFGVIGALSTPPRDG